jgi:hypothetical protein
LRIVLQDVRMRIDRFHLGKRIQVRRRSFTRTVPGTCRHSDDAADYSSAKSNVSNRESSHFLYLYISSPDLSPSEARRVEAGAAELVTW